MRKISNSQLSTKNVIHIFFEEENVIHIVLWFILFFALQQVLEFLSHLIRLFGDNIQIVVKPTLHDGMNVGVHWKFGKS